MVLKAILIGLAVSFTFFGYLAVRLFTTSKKLYYGMRTFENVLFCLVTSIIGAALASVAYNEFIEYGGVMNFLSVVMLGLIAIVAMVTLVFGIVTRKIAFNDEDEKRELEEVKERYGL